MRASRVVASLYAHKDSGSAILTLSKAVWAWHSSTDGCHGVGRMSPDQLQIWLVRIGAHVIATMTAVEALLQRRWAGGHHVEGDTIPSTPQQTARQKQRIAGASEANPVGTEVLKSDECLLCRASTVSVAF